ncbi:MAG: geranyl transferase [Planctomycetaceae bacterium]|nr:geranyl transferase [Planctomycetaceae bacterium]
MQEPYLIQLGNRLSQGLTQMAPDRRERHRQFILSHQMEDGGFRGREGDSDLYYTSFAVRGLAMLGGLGGIECDRLFEYVKSHRDQQLNVVDLVSWLYTALAVQIFGGQDVFADANGDWPDKIAEQMESVRTEDGGYAKSVEGASGSTYHTFLVALTYELISKQVPRPNSLVQFVYDRQRDDGGFVEIAAMKRSGTNPTAAAAALLKIFDALDDELCDDVREYLGLVRGAEGGFQANTRIPFADGLSTFTALLTTLDLDLDPVISPAKIEEFIAGDLEFPTGGFRGASWDEQADVEYTFYGLGTLGLLWS